MLEDPVFKAVSTIHDTTSYKLKEVDAILKSMEVNSKKFEVVLRENNCAIEKLKNELTLTFVS